jgi:virulence-associated protein VapD
MEIRFDEDKLGLKGKNGLAKMHEHLDDWFTENGFAKKEEGLYFTDDGNKDKARCSEAISALSKLDWFTENVAMWNWHKPDDFDPDTMEYEDVLAIMPPYGYCVPAYAKQASLIDKASKSKTPYFKALSFKLDKKALVEAGFSAISPASQKPRKLIRKELTAMGMEPHKDFMYRSAMPMGDAEIIFIAEKLGASLPWLAKCMQTFDARSIGETKSLLEYIKSS